MTSRSRIIPDTARLGRTALVVTNLDEVLDFYRDVIGLTVRKHGARSATLGTAERTLLVLQEDESLPPRDPSRAGLFHNAFRVPSRKALGAALERVRDHWQLDGASDHYVSEALYLTDPEGNGVEIYWDRPKEEWPRADDGTIRIGTIPLNLSDLATESDGSRTAPVGTTVGHVHLEVTAVEAAREFYNETLGFRIQTATPSALFLAAGDYHHHLGLNTWNGRSERASGRGLAWFEFVVPDEELLETMKQQLTDANLSVTVRTGGFELTDPDGIAIRFGIE